MHTQFVVAVPPVAGLCENARKFKHWFCTPLMQYVLIGHWVHAVLVGFANVPLVQRTQEARSVLAMPELILPMGHWVHVALTCAVLGL